MSCIEWTGTLSADGYGRQWVNSLRLYKQAHRLAYCRAKGVPLANIEGLVVRHTCDNRKCVNPAHLVPGTCADNSRDMVERGRQASGEANGNAKLTDEAVAQIRAMYVKGSREAGGPALGRMFGVTSAAINNIVRNKVRALAEKGL